MQYHVLFKEKASFVPSLLHSLVEIFNFCVLMTTYFTTDFSKLYFEMHKFDHGLISQQTALENKQNKKTQTKKPCHSYRTLL